MNIFLNVFMIIVLTGQSNMVKSAYAITKMMPGYTVVNCAVGGSSVAQWQRGQPIYNRCVAKVKAEIERGGVVVGIMHFQGERDTREDSRMIASQWDDMTYRFLSAMRTQFHARKAPIVYAQIGTAPNDSLHPYWSLVQRKQIELRIEHPTARLWMIKTSDLEPHCPDGGVHWCSEVYPVIAQRFVNTFLSAQP